MADYDIPIGMNVKEEVLEAKKPKAVKPVKPPQTTQLDEVLSDIDSELKAISNIANDFGDNLDLLAKTALITYRNEMLNGEQKRQAAKEVLAFAIRYKQALLEAEAKQKESADNKANITLTFNPEYLIKAASVAKELFNATPKLVQEQQTEPDTDYKRIKFERGSRE